MQNPMSSKPRILFMGAGEIGLPTLRWLINALELNLVGVVTQPDKAVGRSQVLTAPAPKQVALENGLPVLQPSKVRRSEALNEIRELAPELIIVMDNGQILPKALLEMPRIACLNLHASLLPRHRGAAPIQAAILSGDKTTGITVMHMAEGLDTGDIVLTRSLAIRHRETGGSLHDRLAALAPEPLAEAIALLLRGNAPRTPQDETLATYASKLDRDSGKLDWTQSCWYQDRLIRAMNPWPGAYTQLLDGKRLKIHRALPMHRRTGAPAELLGSNHRGLIVGCGEGSILLLEVQLEGKRRMPALEFTRGHAVKKFL